MSDGGYAATWVIAILFFIGFCVAIVFAIRHGGTNNPTWRGIIISALLGMLPLYLILCFFGVMGEERDYE